jgi:CP family cyanate transporter-like MFS transporter
VKKTTLSRWILAGMIVVALMLRAPITGVPPALLPISETLALNATAAGLVTTLPLICFGVFAFLSPVLSAKLGVEPTMWAAMALLLIGIGVRLAVGVTPFFTGTLLIGLGVAIGNVIVPALARTWFAHRLVWVMGLYSVMLQVSGSAGPFVTSLGLEAGAEWPVAIGVWVIPGALALALWTVVSLMVRKQGQGHAHKGSVPSGLGQISRRPIAWLITFVMGVQSLLFYTLVTWLPTQFRLVGLSTGEAGLMLTIYTLLGIPGSFLAAWFTTHHTAPRNLIVLFTVYTGGLVLLIVGTPWSVIAGAIICGLGQGICLSMALTFIAHQPNPADVPALSALAQGAGYLIAATGPVLFGFLYARTGGLQAGELMLVGLTIFLTVGSVIVARWQRAHAV